jgi:Raf kinase inhibitor-like YbhB/YbcL family protein
MRIESPAFGPGAVIPAKYTCSGADVSPPLVWDEAPPGTERFALICDDPDAPAGVWDHWVIFDMPAASAGLPEGVATSPSLADGSHQGKNGWGTIGWRGPCPPPGKPHRYFFHLYALAKPTKLKAGATSVELRKAIAKTTLGTAEYVGTYGRG